MIKTSQFLALGGLLALVSLAPMANANILAPGGFGPPDLLTPSGTIQADTGVINYTTVGASTFTGQAREIVLSGDPTNIFGGLDFIYQISVTAGPDSMDLTSAASFAGFLTDVGYCSGCPNLVAPVGAFVAPASVDRSATGSTVDFLFPVSSGGTVNPGEQTFDLVIETNATSFKPGTFEVLDGSSLTMNGFAPATVPEPVSSSLLLGGLFGLGLVAKRRFSLKQN